MLKKTKAQLELECLYLKKSQQRELNTLLELVKLIANSQDKSLLVRYCLLTVWKICRYDRNISFDSFINILSGYLSDEQLKDVKEDIKKAYEDISKNTLPSALTNILVCKCDKYGEICSIRFDNYRLQAFLEDVFNIRRVNLQLAYWDGKEYKLGNTHLYNIIARLRSSFEISTKVNYKDFVSGFFEQFNDNCEVINTNIIPAQNYDIFIDKNNPCIETTKLLTKTYSRVVTNAVNISLPSNDPKAFQAWCLKNKNNEKFRNFILQITSGDKQKEIRLAEVIGNLLIRGVIVKAGALVFLLGDRSSAKSTFLNIAQEMFGQQNCCSINPNYFGEKFALQDAIGKPINIVHEAISSEISENSISKLKSIVTDDQVAIESKYEAPISTRLHLKSIIACNSIPPIKWDDAFLYRIQIIPFTAFFSDSSFSTEIVKDKDFLNAFFIFALEGCFRLIKNGKFSDCKACDEALEKYKERLSPINEYISFDSVKQILFEEHSGNYTNKSDYEKYTVIGLYNAFRSWAEANGYYGKKDYPNSTQFKETVLSKYPELEIKKGNFYSDGIRSQNLVFSKKENK